MLSFRHLSLRALCCASIVLGPCFCPAASNVTLSSSPSTGGAFSGTNPRVFTPTAATATANDATILGHLDNGLGVTINTASGAAGAGDLLVSSPLAKAAGATSSLTLNAVRDLSINAAISSSSGALPIVLSAGRNLSISQPLSSNDGDITISPVQLFTAGAEVNSGSGQIRLQTGTTASETTVSLTGSTVRVAQAASLRLQGTISGNLVIAGNLSPAPLATTGSLHITEGLILESTATTVIHLGGVSPAPLNDTITAAGPVTVAGTLQVNITSSLHEEITNSSSFTILQGSTRTGTFSGYPDSSRYTLANDYGSFRVNYTDTSVILDDWRPFIVDLAWDPGTAEAGSQLFNNTNTRAGRHYFRVLTQSTDIGAWRSRLNLISGEASLYLSKPGLPTVTSHQFESIQTGADGLMLRDDQFGAGEEWFILVHATAGAQWTLFSGRAYVHNLGALPFTDNNGNAQYDIGETVAPQNAPASPMPPEGIRFYTSIVPAGTPAWSLWLNGSTRPLALRTAKVPFHEDASHYTRRQSGQMLMVPPVLGTGSNAYFLSVLAPKGEIIGLDSRIQTVTDLPFTTTLANIAVTAAPYRVYRVQVPIDQIAWDVSTTAIAGNPNVAVRKDNVPAEFDNDAFSEAPGNATDSVTLVPDFLTNGTWFITVSGNAAYTFTLRSGNPVVTPINFTDLKTNDQPLRAGWRFYSLTNIPAQVGSLGWELFLSNQVPGTQIAVRRNKVPGRWQYRTNGSESIADTTTQYMDESGLGGFLQRPGHQADVWYIGIFTPQIPLGAFTLDVHPIGPGTAGFNGSTTAVTAQRPGLWTFTRIDVPATAGVLGWDLRLRNVTSGDPQLVVRRDQLPASVSTNWSPSSNDTWPSGSSWAGQPDWTARYLDASGTAQGTWRLVMGMGRPLEPGTYYIGVYNGDTVNPAAYTLESRGIGTGQLIPVTPLAYAAGSAAVISNLVPREAQYFKVTIPANTPSWELTLDPNVGELLLALRRSAIPDFSIGLAGDPQSDGDRQVRVQKAGAERYVLLPLQDEDFLVAGDYYLAVVGEGQNPADSSRTGSGTSSGTLTSRGPLIATPLGTATAAGITQAVTLLGGQVKTYSFTVPVNTSSLEVRLDNRTGNPWLGFLPGNRPAAPPFLIALAYYYGQSGGQIRPGYSEDDNLVTLSNPAPGAYQLTLRAGLDATTSSYPDASANLVVVASTPAPVNFNGGTSAVTGQAPTAWRFFQITVPATAGVLGWDLRLRNVTSGDPQLVVRRDQLPASVSTNWSPSSNDTWPSGSSWAGQPDWTARYLDASGTAQGTWRLVMGMGRPLEPGTYYIGVYNGDTVNPAAYTLESRGIGTGQLIPVTSLAYAAGSAAAISNLVPREAQFFKVTIPANTPSWELTLDPNVGELLLALRRSAIPDFSIGLAGDPQSDGDRQVRVQKAGAERYVLLPLQDEDFLVAGDYYLAVVGEGQNPADSSRTGSGTSSGTLTSRGPLIATPLGTATAAGITQAVTLLGGQVKTYSFTVPVNISSLEVRLDNRTGNPWLGFLPGNRPAAPPFLIALAYYYGQSGGQIRRGYSEDDNLVTLSNPAPGAYQLTLRAALDATTSSYPDASATLVVRQKPPVPLNFSSTLNGNGLSHTDTRQLTDQEKTFYEVPVPTTVSGQAVIGWILRTNVLQGSTSLRVYPLAGGPAAAVTVPSRTAVIAPPFLTLGETWLVEVQAGGLTNYTLTSSPVVLERAAWAMPTGNNTTFADTGTTVGGTPLPGDRGIDLGQDDWHFYGIDVPSGNAGLLRTELQAINGNPNLYLRETGVPTTDHASAGNSGSAMVDRSLTGPTTEYGNWVPLDGRYESQLQPGRWVLGVKATGGTNARYRLLCSTGQVTDLSLNGGTAAAQTLVGGDWRYYRFTVPVNAPNPWNLTFSQQVGDVVMWLRDTIPPGHNQNPNYVVNNWNGSIESWASDQKNQGPYDYAGHDAAGTYPFATPPLRPGHTYYAGFRANNDATFTVGSSVGGGTIGTIPVLNFYTGTLNATLPANGSVLYQIPVPVEATRLKWTATHEASVVYQLEQGTLPSAVGGTSHFTSSGANSTINMPLSAGGWPWLPGQTYYLRITNTAATPALAALTMNGKNALTEDEDNDLLPDEWENRFFGNTWIYHGSSDPDEDGIVNLVEYAFGGLPLNATDIKPVVAVLREGSTMKLTFQLPDPPPAGLVYSVEATDTPEAAVWDAVATRDRAGTWTGPAMVSVGSAVSGWRTIQVIETNPAVPGKRFSRIRVGQP